MSEYYLNKILLISSLFSFISLFVNAQFLRGPYLQVPLTDGITICWQTQLAKPTLIKYWNSEVQSDSGSVYFNTPIKDHRVKLKGLKSGTKYCYSIINEQGKWISDSSLYYFKTSPITVSNFSVWVIGDFGKGNEEQVDVKKSFIHHTKNELTDLWIWLGDNAYQDGSDDDYNQKVFDLYYGYDEIFPRVPFMPTPGNHDYNSVSPIANTLHPSAHKGPYYDIVEVPTQGEMGGKVSGTELYYSFNYSDAHFISLNSELGSITNSTHDWIGANPTSVFKGSPMLEWLIDDLEQNEQKWTVVYFHQPPHTAGSHSSETFYEVYMKAMRENFLPVLERYGVDVVMCGHSHVYERSYLLRGFYDLPNNFSSLHHRLQKQSGSLKKGQAYRKYEKGRDPNAGTIYVVQGNSGSKTSDPKLDHPAMYYSDGCDTCVGSTILYFDGDTLTGKYLRSSGEILDEWSIIRSEFPVARTDLSPNSIIDLKATPNPFFQDATVSFISTEIIKARIELLDMRGRNIENFHEGILGVGLHSFQISQINRVLAPGNYIFRINYKNKFNSIVVTKNGK